MIVRERGDIPNSLVRGQDRFEPRARKRNTRKADTLMKPRHEAKREWHNDEAITKCHS